MTQLLSKVLILIVGAMLFTSCAYFTDKIELHYIPLDKPIDSRLVPKNTVSVLSVNATDNRRSRIVGYKKGEYNVNLGAITLDTDLSSLIQSAITAELELRNFIVGGAGNTIEVEINNCTSEFTQGFFNYTCDAELILNVNVVKPDDTIIYTKSIFGHSDTPTVWRTNGKNAKVALESALSDALSKLMNDRAFIQALQKN